MYSKRLDQAAMNGGQGQLGPRNGRAQVAAWMAELPMNAVVDRRSARKFNGLWPQPRCPRDIASSTDARLRLL